MRSLKPHDGMRQAGLSSDSRRAWAWPRIARMQLIEFVLIGEIRVSPHLLTENTNLFGNAQLQSEMKAALTVEGTRLRRRKNGVARRRPSPLLAPSFEIYHRRIKVHRTIPQLRRPDERRIVSLRAAAARRRLRPTGQQIRVDVLPNVWQKGLRSKCYAGFW